MQPESTAPQIAYYYPNPMWSDGDWIKNLILFFDGVGILVPGYMKEKISQRDPAIYAGLEQAGLLHVLEPEVLVDQAATVRLSDALSTLLDSGALNELAHEQTQFAELSRSRLGYFGDIDLAKHLESELRRRGLARESNDGLSIPMHPMVRSVVLTLLAQILRAPALARGLELCPATDSPKLVAALAEILAVPHSPSAASVVTFDMNVVGVDLGATPLPEVLAFRRDHKEDFQRYSRSVRLFVHQIAGMPALERRAAFEVRQAELDDLASDLRKVSRSAWKQPASFALSLAGAAWTLATGDMIGAALSAAGALAGIGGPEAVEVGAFSYLFQARSRY